jgi:acyl-CoA thioesterase I
VIRKLIFAFVFGFSVFAAAAEPVTIAALGDSLTQGYGLKPKDGFVPQLQSWLDAKGADVVLINAGVSGDTTAGGASRVAWTLTPEVDAMIVTLGGNDLLRGIAPDVARANLASILRAAGEANIEVLLIGLPAPGNYGPDYKAAFDAIYPELATQYDTLYAENFLAGVTTADGRADAGMMQSDGIHPNAQGVKRIVEVLGPQVLALIKQSDVDG